MLNLSPHNSVTEEVNTDKYNAFARLKKRSTGRLFLKLLTFLALIFAIVLFLPWTQNIQSNGRVTTLKPNQRPQVLHSIIAGRIEKWFVQEGDFVNKGDTLLFISEVNSEYFDPELLARTEDQLKAKEMSVNSYMSKVAALDAQIDALNQTSRLKLQQAKNKVQQMHLKITSDSMDLEAAKIQVDIAEKQMERYESLHEEGLQSTTELENMRLKYQSAKAQLIAQKNKLLTSRNELINAEVELNSIRAQYADEISKAESEKYTAMSSMYEAEAVVTKIQNQYMNYSVRSNMYYITAPQDGYITRTLKSGIGETIKEGEEIASIMPADHELAVELFIRPVDLPLLEVGQHVRIQFDGWPAIVFSGWPESSYGTFGGTVYAIDRFANVDGYYRILVKEDATEKDWPEELRVGTGTISMIMLKDVPVWYELWRKINGFPPDFYKASQEKKPKTDYKEQNSSERK